MKDRRVFIVALTVFVVSLLTAIPILAASPPSVDYFNQCANGAPGTPPPWCPGNGPGWVTGIVSTHAQYQPGMVVPQRVAFKNVIAGNQYSVTISFNAWDSAKQGHAYDYWSTYTVTVNTADACDGHTDCALGTPPSSKFLIPNDPTLFNGTPQCGFGAVHPPYPPAAADAQFYMWNGTINSVSTYIYSSNKTLSTADGISAGCLITTSGDMFIGLTITFTAGSNISDTVLAYGGHIASDQDWPNHAAPTISGASYHQYVVACGGIGGCGSQDNQVQISPTPTAVRLSKFGVLEVVPAHVTLNWTTASEINTAGFNVYRSESAAGPYMRVNAQLIPASSDSLVGGKYQYQDSSIVPGKTYFYQLEDVEYNGTSMRHPAVSATVAAAPGLLDNAGGALMGLGVLALAMAGAGFVVLQKKSRPA